jgi:Na+-transporting NADH:ubiquinone oxidoreductase subunit B
MTESKTGRVPLIHWQRPMVQMLSALAPIAAAAAYFFGWRVLVLLAVVNAAGLATEYLFVRRWQEPVSSAVLVTGTLLTFSLPPTLPLWMGALGAVFGVVFGKMVFGGFGRNVFNPALVGRAFLYVSFPVHMTNRWVEPVTGPAGGLASYAADAVSSATPMALVGRGEHVSWAALAWGNVAGSLGETSAVLIVLGGLYILWRRAADWRIVVAGLCGMTALMVPLWLAGAEGVAHPLSWLLAGSTLIGLLFYITEPVSACRTVAGKWIYGLLFGLLVVTIRTWSVWPAGTMFAVLLANVFGPIVDHVVRVVAGRKEPGPA